jgi:hypothetical protein
LSESPSLTDNLGIIVGLDWVLLYMSMMSRWRV